MEICKFDDPHKFAKKKLPKERDNTIQTSKEQNRKRKSLPVAGKYNKKKLYCYFGRGEVDLQRRKKRSYKIFSILKNIRYLEGIGIILQKLHYVLNSFE